MEGSYLLIVCVFFFIINWEKAKYKEETKSLVITWLRENQYWYL